MTARMAEYKLAEKDKFRGAKIAAAGSLTGGLLWNNHLSGRGETLTHVTAATAPGVSTCCVVPKYCQPTPRCCYMLGHSSLHDMPCLPADDGLRQYLPDG